MLTFARPRLPVWICLPLAVALACAGDDNADTDTSGLTAASASSASATSSSSTSTSAGSATTSASAGTSTSASSGGAACGDGVCDPGESCADCSADCGACETCTEAPTCPGDPTPPTINTHLDTLDIYGMQVLDPPLLHARLGSAVDSGAEPVRILAAALAPAVAGEPHPIADLRERLLARPQLRTTLLHALASVGLTSPALYRDTFPPARERPLAAPASALSPRAACSNPHVRVRVARLDVVEEDDDFANDIVYCLFSTEASGGSEIRVTKPTSPLDEGDYAVYSLAEGVIWGQQGQLRPPGGNLLITYNCFESESGNDGFAQLVGLLGDAAQSFGGIAGTNGWIFEGAGAVASVIAMALALDNDDRLLVAQQSLGAAIQIQAANGVYWLIDRSGVNLNSDWNWVLRMEAWGCAEG